MGLLDSVFGRKKAEEAKSAQSMPKSKSVGKAATEKDLVCGMDVDPKNCAGKSEYQGKTYYFCAAGCKKAFDKEPNKYISGGNRSGHMGRNH